MSPAPVAPRQRGAHVWDASIAKIGERWSWHLNSAQIDELLTAAEILIDRSDEELRGLRPTEVPLPTLGPALVRLREQLIAGRGFELVKGLPLEALAPSTSRALFAAIGIHLGSLRSQNAEGHLLGHVRNIGRASDDPNVRIYQTSERQTFHTDSTDVVGLLCLETAKEGGISLLASAAAVYNRMLDEAPDLALRLFDPIATDRRGEVPAGAKPYFEIPVLNWFDDRLTVIYQRQYIESSQRFADAPRIDSQQREALDLFDRIVNEPGMHLRMELARGDMQFVHNHGLLHDRTAFIDKPDAPRHLLRLWLSVPGDRRLPPAFEQRYGSIEVGDRGGIAVG